MKYLCLAYEAEETFQEHAPRGMGCGARRDAGLCRDALKRSGHLLDARPLHSANTATTLKVRNGKLTVTDGPFAETKEQLGGYFLIEARDLNEAIQVASRCPGARYGEIEVRPVEEQLRPEGRY
jgi:hypothetical protein